jgi:CRP-like cAMP-binding protein
MPTETRVRLLSQSTRVPLQKEDVLCEAGNGLTWVYLPCSGLISLQTMTEKGDSVEIAMVGREGMIGPVPCEPGQGTLCNAVVSVAGDALRIRSESLLAEFDRSASCRRVLLNYSHGFLRDVAQGSACHRFHTARQRLARWVLTACDRTGIARIEITQEELAQRLGLQRTRVTSANLNLQDSGAIRSRHGRITIADRRRLELAACECYRPARTVSASLR